MILTYIEKGIGLHEQIAELGLPALEFVNGEWWHPTPELVQPIIDSYDPLPRLRADLHAHVAQMRIDRQQGGASYTFPDGVVGTIQTRDTQDLININGLATRAMMAPAATFQFRDHENRTHDMSALQVAELATAAAGFVESLYQAKWTHDTAIDAWDGSTPYDVLQYWPE